MSWRLCSGSVTPAQRREEALLGAHRHEVDAEARRGTAARPARARPAAAGRCRRRCRAGATPIARCTSAAATEESTPPDSPQSATPSPTCARTRAIASSMNASIVQVPCSPQMRAREVREQLAAALRVGHLGVELQAPDRARSRGGRRRRASSRWCRAPRSPAAGRSTRSPWLIQTTRSGPAGKSREERGLALELEQGAAVLAVLRLLDHAAQPVREQLHAVADAEHRQAELEDARVEIRGARVEHARGPAREHDARRGRRRARPRGRASPGWISQ